MENIVKREIHKFINNENGLKGNEWKENYFSPIGKSSQHISIININELNQEDLLRFLMYLLLEKDCVQNHQF
jgi:hypothetical protein